MSGTSERTGHEPRMTLAQALLMDTASEPFFDRLLRLAADQVGVPIAFLTVREADEEQLKSGIGLPDRILQHRGMPVALERAEIDFAADDEAIVPDARRQPPLIGGIAIGSYVALRLRGQDDEPIAVLHLADQRARDWTPGELHHVRAFADMAQEAVRLRRATLAIGADQVRSRDSAARRHRAETDAHRQQAQESAAVEQLSRRLQRALLPARLDADLEASIVVLYEPGSERMLLGGDFLDVRRLPDGRISFVLGDVCGHGPEAAALAVALRASWNALQDDGLPLETIANRLGRTVVREQPDALLFATALLGLLDPRSGSVTALSAGHPMPIAIGGRPETIELPLGLPLGLAGDHPAPWRAGTAQLRGRGLLVYTDGLIEGRVTPGSSARLGEEGLLDAIGHALDAGTPPRALGGRLLDHATRAHGSLLPDDVALLHLLADG